MPRLYELTAVYSSSCKLRIHNNFEVSFLFLKKQNKKKTNWAAPGAYYTPTIAEITQFTWVGRAALRYFALFPPLSRCCFSNRLPMTTADIYLFLQGKIKISW